MTADAETVELAAQLLSACACNGTSTWEADVHMTVAPSESPADVYSIGTDAALLARAALACVPWHFHGNEAYAYAEAMLRTGWQP